MSIALLAEAFAAAAPAERQLGPVSVEFDPITTPLGARNLLVYVEPPGVPHASVSAVAFASDFPTWMDEVMGYRNRGEDFDVKVLLSPGATFDWFLAEEQVGWHVGTFVFYWRYEAQRNGDDARFDDLIALPRVGYRWFPFSKLPLYVDPFAGLMFAGRVRGDGAVDGGTVRSSPILPFATAHLGLHF